MAWQAFLTWRYFLNRLYRRIRPVSKLTEKLRLLGDEER
jgi:hypothetical protein